MESYVVIIVGMKKCSQSSVRFVKSTCGGIWPWHRKGRSGASSGIPSCQSTLNGYGYDKRKHAHEEMLAAFAAGKADILLGTQMIVKGHDYANVTLVGILAADLSLHEQDF